MVIRIHEVWDFYSLSFNSELKALRASPQTRNRAAPRLPPSPRLSELPASLPSSRPCSEIMFQKWSPDTFTAAGTHACHSHKGLPFGPLCFGLRCHPHASPPALICRVLWQVTLDLTQDECCKTVPCQQPSCRVGCLPDLNPWPWPHC